MIKDIHGNPAQIVALPRATKWDALARASVREDVLACQACGDTCWSLFRDRNGLGWACVPCFVKKYGTAYSR